MVRAVIVDDEVEAREVLRTMLHRRTPEVNILAEGSSVTEAMALTAEHKPDLLFLDVQMPGGSGFDLLKQLGTWDFDVIFITGNSQHAIQAIRFSALDYLMKPVLGDELRAAIDRHIAKRSPNAEVQTQLLHNLAQPDQRTMKLTLTHGDRTYAIAPAEVAWCQADDNYTALHLADDRRFVSARTLKDYDEMLSPHGFLRVHKSSLVNRKHVEGVEEGHVRLRNGTRVEISRRRLEEVTHALRAS
ncbi:MAG: LytTR family DNA-binding domain-containing protein [Flavobacteriales bacterium]|jgi:two-component system LytT family response regulator|nr:response regulator transcription factor [Flavobacteriales bacterium]MCI1751749.1 LytTR family DNA-binding domain-containing protein [Flavobacteriales bacterium]